MNKISSAKKVFVKIDQEIDAALEGSRELKQLTLLKLKTINEEMSDLVVDLLKKNYERETRETMHRSEIVNGN